MVVYDPSKAICSCARVTYGDVVQAVADGVKTFSDLKEKTRAAAFCGSCTERVDAFFQQALAGTVTPQAQEEALVDKNLLPAAGYRQVCSDLYWVGACDRSQDRFEKHYPVVNGISFNSYLLLDRKTVLLDTVDQSVREVFLRNIEALLAGRPLDYLVVNHMEPDHCATLEEVLRRYPKCQAICTTGAKKMIAQFFGPQLAQRVQEVRDGVSMAVGEHILSFHAAPMVHWPEVMVTYDRTSQTLFSADAFGAFGALDGNLFAHEVDFSQDWLDEFRRYYTNIVGKYGPQVQSLLKKTEGMKISRICPLHGPVWQQDLPFILDKYQKWSTYTPEETGVVIAFASVYGNTELACHALASALSQRGVRNVRMFDVSRTHASYIISEAFRFSHLVLASVTYNGGLFPDMENLILQLKAHNLKNRTAALVENGSWAPVSGRRMEELLSGGGITLLPQRLKVESALKQGQIAQVNELADALAASMKE